MTPNYYQFWIVAYLITCIIASPLYIAYFIVAVKLITYLSKVNKRAR